MMQCNDVTPMFDSLLDDELPTQTAAEINAHMRECLACSKEWEERQALRQRIHTFGKKIPLPDGLAERIDKRVHRSAPRLKYFGMALSAAAAVLVFSVATTRFDYQTVKAGLTAADMLTDNSPLKPSSADTSDLTALAKQGGFDICPIDLPGYKLMSARLVSTDDKKVCMARLTYVNEKKESLVCYEGCHGQVNIADLSQHYIEGKLFCCGKVGASSIVYWPRDSRDFFMVGTMPTLDMLNLASKS
ncbi:MAG TPA: zf-HC2 domain-containing protein [Candidatus Obscuribacterales bacterium]